ncbi:MAG: putative maltokinase [Nitrospira sp.]
MIIVQDNWRAAFEGSPRAEVEKLLPDFLTASRWFGGKAKSIRSAKLADVLQQEHGHGAMVLVLIDVSYHEGGTDRYTLPLTAAFESEADRIKHDHPQAIIGTLTVIQRGRELPGILYDALWHPDCAYSLLECMGRRGQFRGSAGTLVGSATELFDEAASSAHAASSSVLKGEQSNTSVKFGDWAIMKLYRRIEPGTNPELEVGRTLTARHFTHSPALIGALEYMQAGVEPTTLALTQTFVANKGNAWDYTLTQLSRYADGILTVESLKRAGEPRVLERLNHEQTTTDLLLGYRDSAHLLGRRTGELHMALGQASDVAAFTPEACSSSYVQSRVQTMQQSATQALALLRRRLRSLSATDQEPAKRVLEQESTLLSRLGTLAGHPLSTLRIRCHGDYHLGQVLYTGEDFVIIDFEGEPAKLLAERRAKFLPMVDLAGMIRSFHYAAHVALRTVQTRHLNLPASFDLVPWMEQWYRTARQAFLRGYRTSAGQASFSPRSQDEFNLLLDVQMLDKAFYELTYELNNRPDWVGIPLTGLLHSMNTSVVIEERENEDVINEEPISRSARQARDEVDQ